MPLRFKKIYFGKRVIFRESEPREITPMKPQEYALMVHLEEIAFRIHHSYRDGRVEFVLRETGGEGHTLYIREDLWMEYQASKTQKLNEVSKQ